MASKGKPRADRFDGLACLFFGPRRCRLGRRNAEVPCSGESSAGADRAQPGRFENVIGQSQEKHDVDRDFFDDRRDGDVCAQ